ncbi:MAG: hypothetical protein EAZ61_12080 [Oscillatoriales cyanobacterium]|nr:MAG: hypothetical protein EAZ61_12080 [Oscillatoriales cyanobacterium]
MEAEQLLRKYADGTRRFIGINLSEVDLSHASLLHINLRNACLSVANLTGVNFFQANLRGANLNVAKLSGAKLTQANLYGANLNVANLIRADLSQADLRHASLLRAEAMRANFREANLSEANLSGAVLSEANLSHSNFSGANLSEVNLSRASMVGANLVRATFRRTNLRGADLSGANFHASELRRVCLSGAKLVEADLREANLRWADLSGANLAGADLSGAKLSGANLTGANLTGANLTDTSLVYTDLSHARLIGVDWRGADLSGAILTGAKLYGVLRCGLVAEEVTCDWVDMSPSGDGSEIQQLTPEQVETFFNAVLPSVQIVVDLALDLGTQIAILTVYYQLALVLKKSFVACPSILVDPRRTTFIFELDSDMWLFAMAYVISLPFAEAAEIHTHLDRLLDILCTKEREQLGASQLLHIQRLRTAFHQTRDLMRQQSISPESCGVPVNPYFFSASTHLTLTNSDNQVLDVYRSPLFGKRSSRTPEQISRDSDSSTNFPPNSSLPQSPDVFDFVKIAATSNDTRKP